ncbi:MAG: AsmA family protein, partial [Catalinimonas sp.]
MRRAPKKTDLTRPPRRWRIAAAVVVGLPLLAALGVWTFSDRIVARVVREVNPHLAVEVRVRAIDLTWWDQFPHLTLNLRGVRVASALPEDTLPLADLERLYLAVDALRLLRGEWVVDQIFLEGGALHVHTDTAGRGNYRILRADTAATAGRMEEVRFNLSDVRLRDVEISCRLDADRQHYRAHADDVRAQLAFAGTRLDLGVTGALHSHALAVGEDVYLRDKALDLDARLVL